MRQTRVALPTNLQDNQEVVEPILEPRQARSSSSTSTTSTTKNAKYVNKSTLSGDISLKEPKPKIKAKKGVTLKGLGSKLSGVYFVEQVKHTFKTSGYTQSLSLTREWKGESMKNGTTSTPPKTANVVKPTVKTRTYTIKKGDTLWAIAKKYYGKGSQYTKIYNANKDKIKNPNKIYPGQVIKIP